MARLLEVVLGKHPRIEIVGKAWTVEEAVRVTSESLPDLVIVASGVVLRQDAIGLAEKVYLANQNAVVIVTAEVLSDHVRQQLLDVCAIPLASDIFELPFALEVLLPDLRVPQHSQSQPPR